MENFVTKMGDNLLTEIISQLCGDSEDIDSNQREDPHYSQIRGRCIKKEESLQVINTESRFKKTNRSLPALSSQGNARI